MTQRSVSVIATFLANLMIAADGHAHVPMLIDRIPANMWHGQRDVGATDYPDAQKSIRADVAMFLHGRFRVTGDRLFVIPPDRGIMLMDAPFQFIGPGQFPTINSVCVMDDRPAVRGASNALHPDQPCTTSVTVGATTSGDKIYTAIALHRIPDSRDELIGYFQLEPLIPDPTKGL